MSAVRTVTRVQDQDDYAGSLADNNFLKYDSTLGKFVLSSRIEGENDANLFVIDRVLDQVAIGYPGTVPAQLKFYVQQDDTNLGDFDAGVNHYCISCRQDCQQAESNNIASVAMHSTLWASGAGPFTNSEIGLNALAGFAYTRPGCGDVATLRGLNTRPYHEAASTVTKAVGIEAHQVVIASSGNVTNSYGVLVTDAVRTTSPVGTGAIDTLTGIYVSPQTLGTVNYGLKFGGHPSHGSIVSASGVDISVRPGADATAANMRIDSSLMVGRNIAPNRAGYSDVTVLTVEHATNWSVFEGSTGAADGNGVIAVDFAGTLPTNNGQKLIGLMRFSGQDGAANERGGLMQIYTREPGSGNNLIECMRADSKGVITIGGGAPGASATRGEIEFVTADKGIILRAPSGVRWRAKISEAGAWSIALA